MIIILRGITGSGKSTITNELILDGLFNGDIFRQSLGWRELGRTMCEITYKLNSDTDLFSGLCTDDEFLVNGDYHFDARMLSTAHGKTLRKFAEGLDRGEHMIVDNTNTTIAEVAPYAALANAYGEEFHVITLLTDPAAAWGRGIHKVPMTNVIKQDLALRASILEWPAWWPQKVFAL